MIGDTTHDLDLARNAGVSAVAVAYGAHPAAGLAALGAAGNRAFDRRIALVAREERLICASDSPKRWRRGYSLRRHARAVSRDRRSRFAGAARCTPMSTNADTRRVSSTGNPGDFFDASKLYLVCATHGALYEPDSGLCVAGPCRGARLKAVMLAEHHGGIYCIED